MGTINRRPLASEQVGTPGLDFSATRGFDSAASGFSAIANRVKRNQVVLDQLQAVNAAQDIDIKYTEGISELRKKYSSDPSLSLNDYLKEAKELENKIVTENVNSIGNKNVRQAVNIQQQKNRGKRYVNSHEWVLDQQAAQGLSLWASQHNTNTYIAENLENIDQLREHINTKVKDTAAFAKQIFSPEEAAKKSLESQKGVVLAYLNGRMLSDPGKGLAEFNSNTIFSKILDTDERKAVKTGFLEAVTGEKKLHKFSVLFENFEPFNKLIEDGSLKNDTKALNDILETAQRSGNLDPELEDTLQSMISASRKQSKLTPTPDAKLFVNLVNEKDRFNRYLEAKDYQKFLKESMNYAAKVLLHESKGELTNSEVKGLLKPMQKFINKASELVEVEGRGFIGGTVDFFKAVFTSDTFKGLEEEFYKDPYNNGIRKIDNILAPFDEYTDEEKQILRGDLTKALYGELTVLESLGIEVTKEVLNSTIKKIFNENPKAPTVDEKKDLSFLDLRSGRKYKLGDDGDYYMVG